MNKVYLLEMFRYVMLMIFIKKKRKNESINILITPQLL